MERCLIVAEFRNNLSVPPSEVNLKLHHDYTDVSKQPVGSIFKLQPGSSPRLSRGFGITYRSYALIDLELHYSYTEFSDQPISPIFKSQPGTSPQLQKCQFIKIRPQPLKYDLHFLPISLRSTLMLSCVS
jgi:hypothetical protein